MKKPEKRRALVFPTRRKLYDFLIQKWKELSEKTIEKKGIFSGALSGGETPVEFYQRLADSTDLLPWDKTHIFLADERFVPFEHPDSNYGMIRENLLKRVPIPKKNIHPITVDHSAWLSAERYEKELKEFFRLREGEFPEFDLIILGIGEDGHTASIFPGDSASLKTSHLASAAKLDVLKHDRITLTLPAINRAWNIAFLVLGECKARIVKKVLEKPQNKVPASLVRPLKGKLFYLLDKSAGSLVPAEKTSPRKVKFTWKTAAL